MQVVHGSFPSHFRFRSRQGLHARRDLLRFDESITMSRGHAHVPHYMKEIDERRIADSADLAGTLSPWQSRPADDLQQMQQILVKTSDELCTLHLSSSFFEVDLRYSSRAVEVNKPTSSPSCGLVSNDNMKDPLS